MADELQFIEDGLQRSQIDEFFASELARAGYGGMDLAKTPMGTQIVLKAEKPGMVIGKGGKNIRAITSELENRFDLDDPQIDVQEVDEPDLNAQIVADRLANALERGWYFRKAGHVTLERIMDAGALGAEIVLSGKVTGNRGRVEKFTDGYVKHNGEPAETIVDRGKGVSVMKLGTIGVNVMIIPPDADLPDDFRIVDESDGDGEDVEDAIEGPDDEAPAPTADDAADEAAAVEEAVDAVEEEVVDEEVVEEELDEEPAPTADDDADEPADEPAALDEEIEAEAEALVEQMAAADEEDDG
ncbi:MAG: 30S ribosomal protein S3 [Halobacteriales archaeon]|nr:30S ribosomal protein S3 [Halobacteriales archaeon]